MINGVFYTLYMYLVVLMSFYLLLTTTRLMNVYWVCIICYLLLKTLWPINLPSPVLLELILSNYFYCFGISTRFIILKLEVSFYTNLFICWCLLIYLSIYTCLSCFFPASFLPFSCVVPLFQPPNLNLGPSVRVRSRYLKKIISIFTAQIAK